MAQLSIPQSLIGALIDIADLGTLDYFAPASDAHWALYDNQRRELLCPVRPAEVPSVEKLSSRARQKFLYKNFPRYIDTPDQIIHYTCVRSLLAPSCEEMTPQKAPKTPAQRVTMRNRYRGREATEGSSCRAAKNE